MEVKYKNWLITGGCGFIGLNLIEDLLKISKNINIRILDNLSVGKREDLKDVVSNFKEVKQQDIESSPKGIELLIGDVRNFEDCLYACKGVDVVVHLAANTGVEPSIKNPRYDLEVNVIGTFNMLEASVKNKVKKFIFASSNAPLGKASPPVDEETAPKPISPYGASKLAGEGYCLAYFHSFGLNTIVLRFGNVYGPFSKRKNSVIARSIKRALRGLPLEIYGDGTQTRDFVYVKDLVRAIIISSNKNIGGEVFHIATNTETSILKLMEVLRFIIKSKTGKEVVIHNKKYRIGDMKRNFSKISKAERLLDYKPLHKAVSIKALEETINYFLELEKKEGKL